MNLKYIKLLVLLVLILSMGYQNGYSGPRRKLGTLAAPELLIPMGSSSTALNGSNLAAVSGIDAMYWNPAGLSEISSKTGEFMFSHQNYIADIKYEYAAGIVKLGGLGSLGASIRSMNFGDGIKVADENNPDGTGEFISPVYLIGTLSYGRAMTDKIHFGTNIKLISESVGQVSASGIAFDFGLQYIAGTSGLRFGVALKNLGSSLKFEGSGLDRQYTLNGGQVFRRVTLQQFDLPTNLEIGLSYGKTFAKNSNIMLSTTFQNSSYSSDEYKFGLEYNYNKMFYLRGAVSIYPDQEVNEGLFGPSFGAGLKYPFNGMNVSFDYAYRMINDNSNGFNSTNQYFTVGLGF